MRRWFLFVLCVGIVRAALILCLCGIVSAAAAQDSTPPASTASIAGIVVKDPGSEPLKKVLLQIIAEDQKQGGDYSVTTDSDGRFRIDNVQPGRYRVFLERTGFMGVNGRGRRADLNTLAVQPGHSVDDLVFHMLSTAVISGRITDEDGDPMSGVRIAALKKVPGKAKREAASVATTDDLGNYRMAGLFPGQYWIVAFPPPDARDYERPSDKSPAGESQPETRYLTTYYPNTYDSAQASPIAVKAGEEMPVNLILVPAKTYRLRGIVSGLAAGQKAQVELLSRLGDSAHGAEVGSDGSFDLHGAGPGSYTLRASTSMSDGTMLTAHTDVTVVAADVDGIKLVPMPSFKLSGHLRLEGQPPADLSQYSINLRQADLPDDPGIFMAQDCFGENAPVDRLGNFEWKNVNPGTYVLQVYGGDGKESFFLKSARIGNRSIDDGFTISGPATLDVVVSTKAATVEGAVTSPDPQGNEVPVANATVVAVPEEKYRKIPSRFGQGATDQYGRFTIRGLAPGNYTLFAWQDLDEDLYYDPDFLKSQESNGVSVKVEEGSRQSIELKLSPLSDAWR